MKMQSHLALGRALADQTDRLREHPFRRKCFLLGNILPDFLFFTYLRGFGKSHAMIGHHLPYSEKTIRRRLTKRMRFGLRSAPDAFRLGLLLHYLSDSFTHPHTPAFAGRRTDHNGYETRLAEVFPSFLKEIPDAEPMTSPDLLSRAREAYDAYPPSPERDAHWIVAVCSAVFFAIESV